MCRAQEIYDAVLGRDDGGLDRLVCRRIRPLRYPARGPVLVQLNPSALRETHWYEYLIRFALGGAVTVVAGLIAARFGPVVGGLFLAFPAIFPASATLIEKHVRRRKEKAGLSGCDAAGKRLRWMPRAPHSEASGLAAFAIVIWLLIERSPAWALALATAAWLAVAVLAWIIRRWL